MKTKINKYIREWETKCYYNGIPDEAPLRLEQLNKVPSYRQICIAILKNDFSLKTLGLPQNKIPVYHEFKKIELSQRKKYNYQLKLNL
jgi:predicted phosphoadenosine phosphosulfate sulfurtransferase